MQVVVAGSADGLSYGFGVSIGAGTIYDQPQHGGALFDKSAAGAAQLMSNVVGNHEKWHDDWSVRRAGGCHSAAQAAVEDIRANKKTLPRARARLVPGSDGGGSDGGGTGR